MYDYGMHKLQTILKMQTLWICFAVFFIATIILRIVV